MSLHHLGVRSAIKAPRVRRLPVVSFPVVHLIALRVLVSLVTLALKTHAMVVLVAQFLAAPFAWRRRKRRRRRRRRRSIASNYES